MVGNADEAFIVTLDPGEGGGEPIVFRSDEQEEIPEYDEAGNCMFCTGEYGEMKFRLDDDFCPDSFSAPYHCTFDHWETTWGDVGFLLSETTYTATWRRIEPDLHLSVVGDFPDSPGYHTVTIVADMFREGYLGCYDTISGEEALFSNAWVEFSHGTLYCGDSEIPFAVYDSDGTGDGEHTDCWFYEEEGTQEIVVYIDPDAYESAEAGDYCGEIFYSFCWYGTDWACVDGPDGGVEFGLYVTANNTVTFDAQGGTVDPAQKTVTNDGLLTSLPTPEYGGRTFLGWFTDPVNGDEVTVNTVFTENTTVYAHWEVPNGYILDLPEAVTVDPDNAFTEVTVDIEALEFYQHANGKMPVRMRLIFEGGTLTSADGAAAIPYKLNVSASTSGMSNQKMRDWTSEGNPRQIYIYISDADRAANYGVFTGTLRYTVRWLYSDNSWSSNIEVGTIPVSLTLPDRTFTVTFDAQGGIVEPAQAEAVNGRLTSLPTPEYGGRTFLGWFTDPASGDQVTADTAFTADTTVYAHWEVPNGYILDLPESVTLDSDNDFTEVTVDIEALEFYQHANGKMPVRMRLIFEGGTLTGADGSSTIPYKLNVSASTSGMSNTKMRDWTSEGNPRQIYIYISDADRAANYGVFTGTLRYTVRWLYSDNSWSSDIETGTIPLSLRLPDPIYTVTLEPGEIGGDAIVCRSCDQAVIPLWNQAQAYQFYYEDNGAIGFKLDTSNYPASFSPSDQYRFVGWGNAATLNPLTSTQTVFTAQWGAPLASWSLTRNSVELHEAGYCIFYCDFETLVMNNVDVGLGITSNAYYIELYFESGTMTSASGDVLPFLVGNGLGENAATSYYAGLYYSPKEFYASIYVDPDDYDNAEPGLYSGTMTCTGSWMTGFGAVDAGSQTITVSIEIPPKDENPYDVNSDGDVNIQDVTALLDVLSGGDEMPADYDFNGDGVVNVSDVTKLLDVLAGNA